MKRIAIFGSTGMTGVCALKHAVKQGFKVRALVRDEAKIPGDLKHKVEAVVGDVTNPEQVDKAVESQEGVVVVLGTRHELGPTTVLSDGLKNIMKSMKKNDIEVISVCLSAFLFCPPEKVPGIYRDVTADHQRMFDALKESGLKKWIAVMPPRIVDSPSSNFTIKYDEFPGPEISKIDLGRFLVDSLEQPEYYHKICGIATNA